MFYKRLIIGGVLIIGCGGLLLLSNQPISSTNKKIIPTDKTLTIAFADNIETLSPYAVSPIERSIIPNFYEGLVSYDQNLTLNPSLAISYGRLDMNHWEFVLRQTPLFFNGKKVTADDVITSFASYQTNARGAFLLQNIEKIEKIDERTIHITTKKPDVLLLSKISRVFIIPKDAVLDQLISQPIGTGPYRLLSWQKGEKMTLIRNDQYWGDPSSVKRIEILIYHNQQEIASLVDTHKINLFLTKDETIHIPTAYVMQVEPVLSTTFLLFNIKNSFLIKKEFRKIFFDIVTQHKSKYITQYGEKQLLSASQFVSNWVTGYKPDMIEDNVRQSTVQIESGTLTLLYDPVYRSLAQWLQTIFEPYGVDITLYESSFKGKNVEDIQQYDLYLTDWYFSHGDAGEFFSQIVHTYDPNKGLGLLNVMRYSSSDIDQLIESCEQNPNPVRRLKDLQNINYTITKKDIIGVPLFELRRIYIMEKNLQFHPRLDGSVLFHDIVI